MPAYTFTHQQTGKKLTMRGDAPPSKEQVDRAFSAAFGGNAPQEQPGFIDRVGADLGRRGEAISGMAERNAPTVGQALLHAPKIAALTLGQAAGGVNDVVGEGLVSGYRNLVPERVQSGISQVAETFGQSPVGRGLKKVAGAVGGVYQNIAEQYPDAEMAVGGSANLLPFMGKNYIARPTPEGLSREYSSVVRKGIDKGIRPTVVGKKTLGQVDKYYANAEDAVKSIVSNKQALAYKDEFGDIIQGALPKNLNEFSQAISQRKKDVFNTYDTMAVASNSKGAAIPLKGIAQELSTVASTPAMVDMAPGAAKYANERAQTLLARGQYTAKDAQDAIATLNRSLEAYYKNPTHETASIAGIDSMIANNLREGLDNVIASTEGPGYQMLKKEYGALKSIEKDVNHRMIVDARKNNKGLIDFTDVFSGGDVINGLITGNPASIGKGMAMKTISSLIKRGNDPNRAVKNMFIKAEKVSNNAFYTP